MFQHHCSQCDQWLCFAQKGLVIIKFQILENIALMRLWTVLGLFACFFPLSPESNLILQRLEKDWSRTVTR